MSLTGGYSHWQKAKLLTTVELGCWVALFNSDSSMCFKKIDKTGGQLGFSQLSAKSYEDAVGLRYSIYDIISLSYEKHYSVKTIDNDLELIALSWKG